MRHHHQLRWVNYHFDIGHVEHVADLTAESYGRNLTIRPRTVELISHDDGKTITYACVEGRLVRRRDGELGNSRQIMVGPRRAAAPWYVNEMMDQLGLEWARTPTQAS